MTFGQKNTLKNAALVAVRDCMGLRSAEKVLIVSDAPLRPMALALLEAVQTLGNEVLLLEMPPGESHGAEPPPEVAGLMKTVDVVLCPTSKSLTHTEARRGASSLGVRVGTLPGISEEIMTRCMNADYTAIARRTKRLARLMDAAETIRVTAPAGTSVVLPAKGRKGHANTGIFHEKGQWGNLPSGESFLAPLEGRSHGVIVVDGSMAGIGVVKTPVRIAVESGQATSITGGQEAEQLIEILKPHGLAGRNIAEFGIGTNDKAVLSGSILEDEKVMGTIHIALGDNQSMGGMVHVASHIDGLVKHPSVWLDEHLIMRDGKFLVDLDS